MVCLKPVGKTLAILRIAVAINCIWLMPSCCKVSETRNPVNPQLKATVPYPGLPRDCISWAR